MRSGSLVSLALVLGSMAPACGGPVEGADAAIEVDAARDAAVVDAPIGCAPIALEPAPGDVLWLVDGTSSWNAYADRYAGASDAVVEAASAWSLGAQALSMFPRFAGEPPALDCTVAAHESLELDWGLTGESVEEVLVARTLEGASSLGPALEGAIHTARARAAESRSRTLSVILVTDASPSTDEACDTTWEELDGVAAAGFDEGRTGGVRTHVLSVIGRAISPDHLGRIDALADAGGGRAAIVNGSRADVAESAGAVLVDIRERTATCSRLLPEGLVPEAITATFPDGTMSTASRVAGPADCGTVTAGFYLDDPADPAMLTLCSGRAGVGGFCELVFLQARALGAPAITVDGSCAM